MIPLLNELRTLKILDSCRLYTTIVNNKHIHLIKLIIYHNSLLTEYELNFIADNLNISYHNIPKIKSDFNQYMLVCESNENYGCVIIDQHLAKELLLLIEDKSDIIIPHDWWSILERR